MNLSSEAARFVPLVRSVVSKTIQTLIPEIDEQDLMECGMQGLVEGLAQYKTRQGLTQRDYLIYRIREAIYAGLTTHIWPAEERREKYLFLKKTNELMLNFHLSAEGTIKRSIKAEALEVLRLLKLLTIVALLCKNKKNVENKTIGIIGELERMEQEFINLFYDQDLDLMTLSHKMKISTVAASRFHLKILDELADRFCGVHEKQA